MSKTSVIHFLYRNHRGEVGIRRVDYFDSPEFKSTPYHPERQHIIRGLDLDKNAHRDFALKDILAFVTPVAEEPIPRDGTLVDVWAERKDFASRRFTSVIWLECYEQNAGMPGHWSGIDFGFVPLYWWKSP